MPLQVPLKTGKASETERGRKTESISILKGGLENSTVEKCGRVAACVCLSEPTASVVWWLLISIQ